VRTHHLHSLSFGYMGLERDHAEARLWVGQLEAREANLVARDAQWVNVLTDRLHAIAGLQEQRELSYGPPWAHYFGGYQDRLLGGPLGLLGLCAT
jgi:hypothetical protein